MRVLIQRVCRASVEALEPTREHIASIERGFVILVGFEEQDSPALVEQMAKKIRSLRVFADKDGKFNLAGPDVNAQYLIVSQFTLFADCRHGNRPSFIKAAPKPKAMECYEYFIRAMEKETDPSVVRHSPFGLYLAVELVNDGPVTLWLDSREIL